MHFIRFDATSLYYARKGSRETPSFFPQGNNTQHDPFQPHQEIVLVRPQIAPMPKNDATIMMHHLSIFLIYNAPAKRNFHDMTCFF